MSSILMLAEIAKPSFSTTQWILAVVVMILVCGGIFLSKTGKLREFFRSGDKKKLAEDWKDPLKRWARCAFSIQSGYSDYAYQEKSWVEKYPASDWDLRTQEDMERILKSLDDKENSAVDLIRYINICRMSVALGLMTNEESWQQIRPMCIRLQQTYSSFEEMAIEYGEARLDWYKIAASQAKTHPKMKFHHDVFTWLQQEIWPQVPFALPIQ